MPAELAAPTLHDHSLLYVLNSQWVAYMVRVPYEILAWTPHSWLTPPQKMLFYHFLPPLRSSPNIATSCSCSSNANNNYTNPPTNGKCALERQKSCHTKHAHYRKSATTSVDSCHTSGRQPDGCICFKNTAPVPLYPAPR